jgi:hypothetical protein
MNRRMIETSSIDLKADRSASITARSLGEPSFPFDSCQKSKVTLLRSGSTSAVEGITQ